MMQRGAPPALESQRGRRCLLAFEMLCCRDIIELIQADAERLILIFETIEIARIKKEGQVRPIMFAQKIGFRLVKAEFA